MTENVAVDSSAVLKLNEQKVSEVNRLFRENQDDKGLLPYNIQKRMVAILRSLPVRLN